MKAQNIFKAKIGTFKLYWFLIVFLIAIIGIILGSFYDLQISKAIANQNNIIGKIGNNFGQLIGFAMIPAIGALYSRPFIYKNASKKSIAIGVVIAALFIAISTIIMGLSISDKDGWGFNISRTVGFLVSFVIYTGVYFLFFFLIDRNAKNRDMFYAATVMLITSLIVLILINFFLKYLAYRPRFRSLVWDNEINKTTAFGLSYYRNWWEFSCFVNPCSSLSSIKDYCLSWPSGHSAIASLTFMFPLFLSQCKGNKKISLPLSILISFVYILFVSFSRMLAGAHFLSDVCFGFLIYVLFFFVILLISEKINKNISVNKKEITHHE